MASETRARRTRTTRRDAKSWIVGEYTLSRNLASLRVGRKPSARFIAGKIAGVLEHVKTMVREIISPSDRQACGCNFSGN